MKSALVPKGCLQFPLDTETLKLLLVWNSYRIVLHYLKYSITNNYLYITFKDIGKYTEGDWMGVQLKLPLLL